MVDLREMMEIHKDTSENILVPSGTYLVEAVNNGEKNTRAGGVVIWIQFKILNGEHKGQSIFNNYNKKCANEVAVSIAFTELKRFASAVGVTDLKDSGQLMQKPFNLTVIKRPDDADFPGHDFKKYKPAEANKLSNVNPFKQ
jgi:hypothetical protein